MVTMPNRRFSFLPLGNHLRSRRCYLALFDGDKSLLQSHHSVVGALPKVFDLLDQAIDVRREVIDMVHNPPATVPSFVSLFSRACFWGGGGLRTLGPCASQEGRASGFWRQFRITNTERDIYKSTVVNCSAAPYSFEHFSSSEEAWHCLESGVSGWT